MLSRYTQSHWSTSFALHHGTQSNHKASEAQSERASKMALSWANDKAVPRFPSGCLNTLHKPVESVTDPVSG
ncbi:hypothetical protein FZX15_12430 [Brucella suis bv. 1]|nr:hypothetical protein FZX15_12430 [Brucella suis bv. 1]